MCRVSIYKCMTYKLNGRSELCQRVSPLSFQRCAEHKAPVEHEDDEKEAFFFVHIIISLSRCAGHRNNNNETHLLGFTWGTDICNCWFLLKGRRPVLRGQLLQLCAEDDSRGKGFSQRPESLSETCGWWEGKREHKSEERGRIMIKYLHFKCCTAGGDVAGSGGVSEGNENQHPAEENTPPPLCLVAQQPERKRSSSF